MVKSGQAQSPKLKLYYDTDNIARLQNSLPKNPDGSKIPSLKFSLHDVLIILRGDIATLMKSDEISFSTMS